MDRVTGPIQRLCTFLRPTTIQMRTYPFGRKWTSLESPCIQQCLLILDRQQRQAAQVILNNEALLQRYTSNFTWIAVHSYIWTAFYTPIELESYHTLRNEGKTGPLEFKPSVISTKYLCQVPQLKSVSDIFISVLLADLVLLSAAWRLYTFLVEQVLLGKGPADNYCEGCLRRDNDDLLLPKLSSPPSRASNATNWFATAPQIPETEYSPLGNVLVENIDRVRTR